MHEELQDREGDKYSKTKNKRALKNKLPPIRFLMNPGDQVRAFQGHRKRLTGRFELTMVSSKIISVKDGIKTKTLNISSILSMRPRIQDVDLMNDVRHMIVFVSTYPEDSYSTEIPGLTLDKTRRNVKA